MLPLTSSFTLGSSSALEGSQLKFSRWLGHRSIKVTVDRYGRLTQDGKERCRQVVEATFGTRVPTVGLAS